MFRRLFAESSQGLNRPGAGTRLALGAAAVLCSGWLGCGEEPPLSRVREDFRVVQGEPGVESGHPGVEVLPRPNPDNWGLARARHCDVFRQSIDSQADILWVVGSSPSMGWVRDRVADAAGSFLMRLLEQRQPVDFRIGVLASGTDEISSDGDGGPGMLQRLPDGSAWIACSPDGAGGAAPAVRCNVGTPDHAIQAFVSLIRGSRTQGLHSQGLLAASLALDGRNPGFLRQDASLSVFFATAEEDTSCGPHLEASPCLASDSCRCDDEPNWGSRDHYRRFFRGLKGYGNEAAVRVGALATADTRVLDFDDNRGRTYVGCTDDARLPCAVDGKGGAKCAFHAPRYLQLAASTGGITADICSVDFSRWLAEFGRSAAGLQSEFRLSRSPIRNTIDIVVVPDEAKVCNDAVPCQDPLETCVRQKCARRSKEGLPEGWAHVISSEGSEMNSIRFGGGSIPEPLHTIEVCYDVDVGG